MSVEALISEASDTRKLWERAERRAVVVQKHMSSAGALGLPEKLDERRLIYGIPDEAFAIQATFKRIFVKQIPDWDGETYGPESKIFRTQVSQQRNRESTPRGVLVSAGLEAQDILHSHGIELGDIVWIVQMAIFRLPVLEIDGTPEVVLVLQAGDIVGCVDTMERIKRGALKQGYDPVDRCSYYEGRGKPISPWIPDDF
jgi:hypothetical protein